MSKSILLSIRPEWVEKILNGKKTIEVRKKFPSNYQGWFYIYCTKGKPKTQLIDNRTINNKFGFCWCLKSDRELLKEHIVNGKVVARFWCDKVEEFNCCCVPLRNKNNLGYEYFLDNGVYKVEWKENINLKSNEEKYNNPSIYKDDGVVFERKDKYIDTMLKNNDFEKMCLTPQQVLDYIALGNVGYAIHISKLEIFDKPKELSEFKIERVEFTINGWELARVKKAPQNYCYFEGEE